MYLLGPPVLLSFIGFFQLWQVGKLYILRYEVWIEFVCFLPVGNIYVLPAACIFLHVQSSPAGLSSSLIVLMSVGVVVSVAVFPIGLILLIAACCCSRGKETGHKCPSLGRCDKHHLISKWMWIICCKYLYMFINVVGVVTRITIFPLRRKWGGRGGCSVSKIYM